MVAGFQLVISAVRNAMPLWMKVILINAALIGAILVMGELIARTAYDNRFLFEGNQYVFFQYDPELGWAGKPNASGQFQAGPEFATQVTMNADGLRDKDYPKEKPAGVFRVAVLGDSFTWGFGIENEDNYTEVLERSLGPGYEVINFGISGYGRGQQWLQLKRQALSYSPDAVIILAYPGNDLYDNLADDPRYEVYPRPNFHVGEDGKAVVGNAPVPKPSGDFAERLFMRHTGRWMGLYMRSYLFRVVYHLFNDIHKSYEVEPGKYLAEVFRASYKPTLERQAAVEAAVLKEIKSIADERRIPLLYAVASMTEQVNPERRRLIRSNFPELREEDIDWEQPTRFMLTAARQAGVEAVDLAPALAAYNVQGRAVHNEKDFHWTKLGYRIAADLLKPWVVRQANLKRGLAPDEGCVAPPPPPTIPPGSKPEIGRASCRERV